LFVRRKLDIDISVTSNCLQLQTIRLRYDCELATTRCLRLSNDTCTTN